MDKVLKDAIIKDTLTKAGNAIGKYLDWLEEGMYVELDNTGNVVVENSAYNEPIKVKTLSDVVVGFHYATVEDGDYDEPENIIKQLQAKKKMLSDTDKELDRLIAICKAMSNTR